MADKALTSLKGVVERLGLKKPWEVRAWAALARPLRASVGPASPRPPMPPSRAPLSPPQITGIASTPDYLPYLPPSTEYRKFAPGSQPVRAIIPHDVPQHVFDIKYFGEAPCRCAWRSPPRSTEALRGAGAREGLRVATQSSRRHPVLAAAAPLALLPPAGRPPRLHQRAAGAPLDRRLSWLPSPQCATTGATASTASARWT
jgi:hypothetical protein